MAANIDPFYIPGIVYAINFKRMPKYAKRFVIYSVALLIYAFLQIIIVQNPTKRLFHACRVSTPVGQAEPLPEFFHSRAGSYGLKLWITLTNSL
jgi:hypothetical protein